MADSSLSQSRFLISPRQNFVNVILIEGGPSPPGSVLVLPVPHHHPQLGDAALVEASFAVQDTSLVHHLDHDSLMSLSGEQGFMLFDDFHSEGDLPLLLRMFAGVVLPHVAGDVKRENSQKSIQN